GGYNFTYYCKVTNKNGSCQAAAVSSASASLLTLIIPDYVPEPPHIITHPKNRTIKIGGSTTFSIEAEGEGLYYEWQYRESDGAYWQPVPNGYGHSGEGTPTLTLTDIDSVYDGVFYRCEVYSYGIIVHSDQAKLTLIEPLPTPELATTPIINQQPADRSVPAGRSTSFYVDASISRGYQWQVLSAGSAEWKNVADGGIYSGAATDTLKLSKPSIDYNGCQYRCVVSGIPGVISTPTVTSNAAKLTVTEAIPIMKHGEVVISGTSGMTLELGYAATSTEAYDIKSKGTATVTKTSGDAKITWNNGTKKLDIAAGLAQGTYPVVLTAASGSDTAEFTFTLTVTDALEQPDISGTSGMTLEPGYEATSTDPLTITGAPAPAVTKTSGNDKITWNNGTKKIDIAAGLAKGNYVVVLKAVNIAGETEFAFTLTVADPPLSEEEGEEETAADPSLSEEDGEEPSGSMSNFRKLRNYTPGMFTDVDEYSWYGYYQGKVICNAYEYGLMQGNSATTFNPTGNITIAEAITVAARVHSIYSTGADNFTPGEPWYKVYVDYAITNKIIAANDFTDYSRAATRAEMAYIFSRSVPESELAPQNTVNSLPDVNSGTPYYNAIIMLYKAGVLAGNDDAGTFHPGNNITRAEAAAIISRVILPATRINGKTFGK
ncbi:MAG: S-layer homology domain-containing protein, partial [Oscillospiraceae bacterium]|nr:S-layer homology domain-containing protein [Oscillospiraceae bacterium]